MSDREDTPNLLNLLVPLGEVGGRFLQGILSNPWTAIPFTIITLSQLDPSGKLTVQFLSNLQIFIASLSVAAGKALASIGQGLSSTIGETAYALGLNSFFGSTAGPPPRDPPPLQDIPAEEPDQTISGQPYYSVRIFNADGSLRQERFYNNKADAEAGFTTSQVAMFLIQVNHLELWELTPMFSARTGGPRGIVGTRLKQWGVTVSAK